MEHRAAISFGSRFLSFNLQGFLLEVFMSCMLSYVGFCRMSLIDVVELSSDDELGEVDVKPVKLELGAQTVRNKLSKTQRAIQDSEENSSSVLDQGQSPLHDTGISCISLAPLCRQFWKAGNYNDGIASKPTFQSILLLSLLL